MTLYNLHQNLLSKETTMTSLASGDAKLFVTPETMHVRLGLEGLD